MRGQTLYHYNSHNKIIHHVMNNELLFVCHYLQLERNNQDDAIMSCVFLTFMMACLLTRVLYMLVLNTGIVIRLWKQALHDRQALMYVSL